MIEKMAGKWSLVGHKHCSVVRYVNSHSSRLRPFVQFVVDSVNWLDYNSAANPVANPI